MLLAKCIRTSSIKSLSEVRMRGLKRVEDSNVTWLELMGCVGGNTTEANVVLQAIF